MDRADRHAWLCATYICFTVTLIYWNVMLVSLGSLGFDGSVVMLLWFCFSRQLLVGVVIRCELLCHDGSVVWDMFFEAFAWFSLIRDEVKTTSRFPTQMSVGWSRAGRWKAPHVSTAPGFRLCMSRFGGGSVFPPRYWMRTRKMKGGSHEFATGKETFFGLDN